MAETIKFGAGQIQNGRYARAGKMEFYTFLVHHSRNIDLATKYGMQI